MKTKLVCLKCGEDWKGVHSPAICPDCGQASAPIAVEVKKGKKRRVV